MRDWICPENCPGAPYYDNECPDDLGYEEPCPMGIIINIEEEKCKMTNPTTNLSTKVITGKCRLSYAHLFKPQAIDDSTEPKYSVCLLIPKTDKETLTKIKAAIDAAKQAGASKWGGKVPPNLKTPLRDGDEERPDQPEYVGCFFLNASSKQKPGIVDRNRDEILDSNDLYSGCYGRASLNFYGYNTAGNKGIGVGLNNVQKLADGDYLGGRSRAEDDFDEYNDTDSCLD